MREFFLVAWYQTFGDRPVTVGELSSLLGGTSRLRSALPDDLEESLGQDGFTRKLGKALATREAKRYGEREFRVERAGKDTNKKVLRWRVRGLRDVRGSSHPESKQSDVQQNANKEGTKRNPRNSANPQPGDGEAER